MEISKRSCYGCLYHQWVGLKRYCTHPDHQQYIKRPVGCDKYIEQTAKTLPGQEPPWPKPIDKEYDDPHEASGLHKE